MANLPMEEIEKKVGSRYALTVLAGKRARELRDGAPQLVNSDSSNPIQVALQEIWEGKIVPENLDLSAEAALAIREAEAAAAAERAENAAKAEAADAALAVAAAQARDAEPSPLAGADLAELTDADAAGISLPGAVDITGAPIDESTPEIATDRLDAVLTMGSDAVAALEDAADPDGTRVDTDALSEDQSEVLEIAEASGIPEVEAALEHTAADAAESDTAESDEAAEATEATEATEE